MKEIEEEVIDLRYSLHKIRTICAGNKENELFCEKAKEEFQALDQYIGCMLLSDKVARELALIRWAKTISPE